MSRLARLLAYVALPAAVALAAGAEPPRPRSDVPDEPLPHGALARFRHDGAVNGVAFLPGGKQVMSGSADGAVRVWDAATGAEVRRLPGYEGQVGTVAASPNGKWVAAGGSDRAVRLWDAQTGEPCGTLRGHRGAVVGLAFAPDGKGLLSAADDGTVILWDAEWGERRQAWRECQPRLGHMALAPDGKTVAVHGSGDATGHNLRLLDLDGGPARGFVVPIKHVGVLAFSPDGTRLAVAGMTEERSTFTEPCVYVLNPRSGVEVCRLRNHKGAVLALAFTADGKALLSGGADGQIVLNDLATGKVRVSFRAHPGGVSALALAPCGRAFASAGSDRSALVWDLFGAGEEAPSPDARQAWEALADANPAWAWRGIAAVARSPDGVLPLMRQALRPVSAVKADELARLVAQLDDDDFEVREGASAQLTRAGRPAAGALEKLLAGRPSVEAARRAKEILARIASTGSNEEWQRLLRSIEALEYVATPEARELLERLAEGDADAQPTRDAKAALGRLEKRSAKP
jgi:dipeptidyl aminopeptidase/acylaminoacyl peptidase